MAGSIADHDRDPAVHDQNPTNALGDALERLQIGGAIFLHARYTEGWAFRALPGVDLAQVLAPDADRVLPFHVVSGGRCWVEVGGQRHWAESGDVVVLPYGDAHQMGGEQEATLIDAASLLTPPPWKALPFIEHGGGGRATSFVCGYITSTDPLFDPTLRALPPVMVIRPTGAAAHWVQVSMDYAMQQTALVGDSRVSTPAPLARLLLVEVLKLHLASAPAAEAGFIRALHDPVLSAAMAEIHRSPGTKWTVADLAAAAHVSESLLDERFRSILGMPPIRYLTTWRMHVAQDLLRTSDLSVLAIARRVGYVSEEAFSRAFKRKHGIAPSLWRKRG